MLWQMLFTLNILTIFSSGGHKHLVEKMDDGSYSGNVPTEDLLGLEAEKPRVRLRPNQPVNRRSEGIIFGDDFQVSAEQEANDKELVKQVYSGMFMIIHSFIQSYIIIMGKLHSG